MDGQTDDFLIDEAGNLVMLDDVSDHISDPVVHVCEEGTVLAVISQSVMTGELAIQVYGALTKELVGGLQQVVRGLAQTLKV